VDDEQRECLPDDDKPAQAHQRVEANVAPRMRQMITQFRCHAVNLFALSRRSTGRVLVRQPPRSNLASGL